MDKLLLLVEFSYSNTSSAIISIFSFFTNKGYHSSILAYSEYNTIAFWACNFAVNLNKLQSMLKAEITIAQQYYSSPLICGILLYLISK